MSRDDSTQTRPAVHMKQAAIGYAREGRRVFPLQPGTKVPFKNFRWREWATSDEAQVERWWSEHPDANIGVACGPGSGLTVLDLDVKGERPGLRTAAELMGERWQDSVPHVRTPSGGVHVWVTHESRWGNRKLVRQGLDVQGEGAYVLAPPSVLDERETSSSRGPYLTVHAASPEILCPSPALMERMRALLGPEAVQETPGGDEGLPEGWQTAELPESLAARLGQHTGAYWRHGELGPYASDSEAVYAVCVNLLGSLRLTPAQALRAVVENYWCWAAATKPHRRSEGGLAAVRWLWDYNVSRAVPPSPFGERAPAPAPRPEVTEAELDALLGPSPGAAGAYAGPAEGELLARTTEPLEALLARVRAMDPGDLGAVESVAYDALVADLSPVRLDRLKAELRQHTGLGSRVLDGQFARARAMLAGERQLARSSKSEALSEGYCFVEGQNRFWNFRDRQWVLPQAVALRWGQETAEALLTACRKVGRVTYRPLNPWGPEFAERAQAAQMLGGRPEETVRYVTEGGEECLNLWQPPLDFRPKLDATEREVRPWLDAARYCVRLSREDWEHVMDWMAFTLQYPGVKLSHLLMLGGGQGIGKDFLLVPVLRALGLDNVLYTTGKALTGKFDSSRIAHSSLVFYSEVHMGSGEREWERMKDAYNDLKVKLTTPPEQIEVEVKHRDPFPIPNTFNVVATTNHYDAVELEHGDRRMFLAWGHGVRGQVPSGWSWRTAFDWVYGEGGEAVAGWLLQRDVSGFDYGGQAPGTEWKAITMDESLSPLELLVRDAVEAHEGPFRWDVVTVEEVLDWARNAAPMAGINRRITGNAMGRVISNLGLMKKRARMPREGGKKKTESTVYLVRDMERWSELSAGELWLEVTALRKFSL